MKKIFAIALALVMVLSMASAFASPCTAGPFDWTKVSSKNCGKMTVEVIPYVKVNTNCAPYYDYEMSTCAAAVAGEKVYYAVKVVIDKNLDREWYAAIANPVAVDLTGMKEADYSLAGIDLETLYDEDEKLTLYYDFADGEWEDAEATGFEFGANNLKVATVDNPGKAKVCVSFTSQVKNFESGVIGNYFVAVEYEDAKNGIMAIHEDEDETQNVVLVAFENGEVAGIYKQNDKCSTTFLNSVMGYFGFDFGTKMDQDLINANFGWEDEVKSCFAWSKAASAIVDAECVVAIPKTGDKGLLWWLF